MGRLLPGGPFSIYLVILMAALLPLACSRSASTLAVQAPTLRAAVAVQIESVEITQGAGIRVAGSANLPAADCVHTALTIDGQPAGWWPGDACIQTDDDHWEIVVALDRNGAPANLDQQGEYAIEAWPASQPEQPHTRFPFDLSPPPPPP
jgi:hypothetical protein